MLDLFTWKRELKGWGWDIFGIGFMFGISIHLGITQCDTQVLSYWCLNVFDFMQVSWKSTSLTVAENPSQQLWLYFPGYYECALSRSFSSI